MILHISTTLQLIFSLIQICQYIIKLDPLYDSRKSETLWSTGHRLFFPGLKKRCREPRIFRTAEWMAKKTTEYLNLKLIN